MSTNLRPLRNIRKRPTAVEKENMTNREELQKLLARARSLIPAVEDGASGLVVIK